MFSFELVYDILYFVIIINSKENIDPEQNNQVLLHTKIGNLKVAKQIDLSRGWDHI
jgi:hypothetical protein